MISLSKLQKVIYILANNLLLSLFDLKIWILD